MGNTETPAATSAAELTGLRKIRPGIGAAADNYHAFLGSLVDPAIVQLCRLRIAQLTSGSDQPVDASAATRAAGISDDQRRDLSRWRASDHFDEAQRACLEMAEAYCYSALSVTDEHVARVAEHLSAEQILALTNALWLADSSTRLSNFVGSLGTREPTP